MAATLVVSRQRRNSLSSSSESNTSIEVTDYTLPYQEKVQSFYIRRSIQLLVAFVILLNFVTAAAQAQILPEDNSPTSRIFLAFEYFYVYAFLIELLVNIYGHWFWAFWKSGWNWFDFIIVLVSLLAFYFPDLPAISVLRLFRAFRVVRLFKRVKEMRKIIEGIMRSLPALSYAFVAMALIMGIWGIMGVGFFGDMYYWDTRGRHIEGYYFRTFFRAILSLGQIMTFDSWSSGIARDIIYVKGAVAAIYFLTYVFIAGIIMMNVLVALLLDNYLSPETDSEDENSKKNKPVIWTPEIVFRQLVKYLKRTEIDISEISEYFLKRTFPEYEEMPKSGTKLNDAGRLPQSDNAYDGYISSECQTIASSLLEIENQLILLRREEHLIYDRATIGNFSFQDKVIKKKAYTLPYQKQVKWFYSLQSVQIFVALVIFMNFLTSAIYVQLLPKEDSSTDRIFLAFEYFYVYGFLIELLINMYGSFFFAFWYSGWNIFDFVIVWVSLLAMYFPDLPAISVLRLFRAFRVVRLFKRVKEMKKIIEGIMKSLPALSYAFVALALITGIWAIMGVDFFATMVHGDQDGEGYYFGNFFKAFLSLIQITTFDSWSSGIARDIIFAKGAGAAFYFTAYAFFSSVIMMNVLVALLLDNYLSPTDEHDENELSAEEAMEQLSTHVRKIELDLLQFSEYLESIAFPDFIAHYQNVEDCGFVVTKEPSEIPDIKPPEWSCGDNEIEMQAAVVKTTSPGGVSLNLADVGNSNDAPSSCSSMLQIDHEFSHEEKGDQKNTLGATLLDLGHVETPKYCPVDRVSLQST